jgi:3-ketosteroid 9alpha-monooxygenase subunit A
MQVEENVPTARQYGTGWYLALWSGELTEGDVVPLKYFGRDLVAFRGDSGKAFILDAHCLHMGAHLGYGGEVVGDDLMCPFHNWQWRGADGANSNIPYLDRCIKKQLKTWLVHEQDGLIYFWFSRTGSEEPTYFPPKVIEAGRSDFYPVYPHGAFKVEVTFPPQFAFENVADLSHLRTVHKWAEVPELNGAGAYGDMFHTDFTGTVPTRSGGATVRNENWQWGPGLIYSRLHGLHPTGQITAATPIDHETSWYSMSVWVQRIGEGEVPVGRAKAVIEEQRRQALNAGGNDRIIWDHMAYLDKAALVGDERKTIGVHRAWFQRFRSDTPAPTPPPIPVPEGTPYPQPTIEDDLDTASGSISESPAVHPTAETLQGG